jgi:hypothetical protein
VCGECGLRGGQLVGEDEDPVSVISRDGKDAYSRGGKITSCTFIGRSTTVLGYVSTLNCKETSSPK